MSSIESRRTVVAMRLRALDVALHAGHPDLDVLYGHLSDVEAALHDLKELMTWCTAETMPEPACGGLH